MVPLKSIPINNGENDIFVSALRSENPQNSYPYPLLTRTRTPSTCMRTSKEVKFADESYREMQIR